MIKVLALILSIGVPLVAGYGLGRLGKKRAVTKAYAATLPVLRAARELLATDPLASGFPLSRQVLQDAIYAYESEVRSL